MQSVPKPPNCFLIFRSDFLDGQAGSQTTISAEAGVVWKGMTDAEQSPYIKEAQSLKQRAKGEAERRTAAGRSALAVQRRARGTATLISGCFRGSNQQV
ncbi:hypothetical protein DFH07DRAFT_861168 [Mycena maculata]|uniref:HMG box domain-containing protein n=1 Tax=Mycena maculata TaxID=230809 RepID=A0AAD7HCL6_9AGAR|nr:hypothetical protein DFH07DRAFT_861168 [Mycena maculata]